MKIELTVQLTELATTIQFQNNQGTIIISDTTQPKYDADRPAVYLGLKEKKLIEIGKISEKGHELLADGTQMILITPPWEIEVDYLEQLLLEDARANGLNLAHLATNEVAIPLNQIKSVSHFQQEILIVLEKFGYSLYEQAEKQVAKKPAKAAHKWSKEVSQIEFSIDSRGSKGTVIWQKRNQMLLKAGANLLATPPLNKDGSIGFSVKMGEKLRADYQEKIKNFVTTEDLLLKSVNEVGLFLYFGGTNSWLELKDNSGKTIDEWTIVAPK